MILRTITSSFHYILEHKFILLMVVVAWILTLLPFLFDGQYGCAHGECGFIVGTNYRDGLWFQAVAETSFKTWPFQMPNFAGAPLRGYHYLPNIVAYLLSLIGIPVAFTYYKLIPIVYMFGMTILSIHLARKIKDHVLYVGLFLFFAFFGMHLSLFTSLYHTGKIQNTVLINTFQATRILESPHAALALLMMFATIILIYKKEYLPKTRLALLGLILFLAFGTKFYIATTILMILVGNEFCLLFQKKHWKQFLINNAVFAFSTLVAIVLFYDPFTTSQSGSIFIFSPFATVHHLIETPTLFYMHNMVLARYYLYEQGWSPRLFGIELFSTFLFILFYFGTRIVGFIQLLKQVVCRNVDRLSLILMAVIIILISCAVLFIQKGDWYNPIQFAVPAAFLMNIFVAHLLFDLYISHKKMGLIIITILLIATFPANLVNAGYLQNPARMVIPQKEMDGLLFLKEQPAGSVFVPIEENAESDTVYVSAMTGKPSYINFTNVLQNADIAHENRLKQVEKLEELLIEDIDTKYIYLALNRKHHLSLYKRIQTSPHLKEIFNNGTAVIYKKNK